MKTKTKLENMLRMAKAIDNGLRYLDNSYHDLANVSWGDDSGWLSYSSLRESSGRIIFYLESWLGNLNED